MKKFIATIILFGIFVTPHAFAASPEEGVYFEDGFLKTLSATQSPFGSINSKGVMPQVINLAKLGNGSLRFMGIDNWHEGYVLLILHSDGTIEDGEQKSNYPKPMFNTPHHFQFRTYGTWRGYTFVGNDVDAEVAKIVLVGKYTDPKGHAVEFGADGVLHGIGEDMRFYLDNDHIGQNHFDFFSLASDYLGNSEIKAIAFKHEGANLILYPIYEINPESDDPSIGKPDFERREALLASAKNLLFSNSGLSMDMTLRR